MHEDMLGFSDTIFPAIPLLYGYVRFLCYPEPLSKGRHYLASDRSYFLAHGALIAMGLFSLNSGGIEGGISHQWFCILMVIGFFLVWAVYPKAEGSKKVPIHRNEGARCGPAGIPRII